MTRESKMAVPSSSNRVGILPSGFCVASVSAGSVTSAWHSTISLSSLRSRIAMRTLRTKGDDDVDRKIIGIHSSEGSRGVLVLHSPLVHRSNLDRFEEQVIDQKPDDRHGSQT